MAVEIDGWKPMPIRMGPPCPRSMRIYWPWYKGPRYPEEVPEELPPLVPVAPEAAPPIIIVTPPPAPPPTIIIEPIEVPPIPTLPPYIEEPAAPIHPVPLPPSIVLKEGLYVAWVKKEYEDAARYDARVGWYHYKYPPFSPAHYGEYYPEVHVDVGRSYNGDRFFTGFYPSGHRVCAIPPEGIITEVTITINKREVANSLWSLHSEDAARLGIIMGVPNSLDLHAFFAIYWASGQYSQQGSNEFIIKNIFRITPAPLVT